jgi:orotate phosphoribosyltransferase
MKTTAQRIAEFALKIGAFRLNWENPFTWASGYRMPVYNDNRLLLRHPAGRSMVRQGLVELTSEYEPPEVSALVAGVATGGIIPATLLADTLDRDLLYLRAAAKSHGLQRTIEGMTEDSLHGAAVILVEDLISTGTSSVAAGQQLLTAGGEIILSLGIFSYGFPEAVDRCTAAGIPPFHTILDFPTLLSVAVDTKAIPPNARRELERWHEHPFTWGAER